ncbi:hypothetical protein VCRA2133E348_590053 [Vibrio crassostreae]|nr:hypothetical protein VCRA2119O48_890001 [Vibrio crassostreae]CAK3048643.1 hypothetical protein VCRA2133E348_590053 [Vibrio crassostreae]CAK3582811.1 hypothetical protein VCRA213O314_640001 [Vibrio crassostreae]CAK3986202.1 hypothetical protein VCRA212O16_550051 [Vibrio crassostreae]
MIKNIINVLTGLALALALLYLTYELTKNLSFVVCSGIVNLVT